MYQAAVGEHVEITGSERVVGWARVQNGVWKTVVPNSLFGLFNPYGDLIHGDWFSAGGRKHHTGAVYLNGEWLAEAAGLTDVLKPAGTLPLWYAEVGSGATTIWAQFGPADPNAQQVEINVRQTVFYPARTGINYVTVRGFTLRNAATPWAPPTAEQIGLIGPHWSRGWIIENNRISHSTCAGVSLGKYGDEYDNRSGNSANGYLQTIDRALAHGWNGDTVGHHVVRNNVISDCEQAGIVGSLGGIFSRITGNDIHDIHVRRLFGGAEMAGIKLHAAVDVEISHNHIYRTARGIWLDWMAQGTRVTANLLNDNAAEQDLHADLISGGRQDMFVEVNHGPLVVDDNLFLSTVSINCRSQGTAYVHNLFAGTFKIVPLDKRLTPYLRPHATEVAGTHDNPAGDVRFYNNLFVRHGDLTPYDAPPLPASMGGNVFLAGARPSGREPDAVVAPAADPALKLTQRPDGLYLEVTLAPGWRGGRRRSLVTGELLGRSAIADLPFERPDGTPYKFDTDYLGHQRNPSDPTPGPFESLASGGTRAIKVWPVEAP